MMGYDVRARALTVLPCKVVVLFLQRGISGIEKAPCVCQWKCPTCGTNKGFSSLIFFRCVLSVHPLCLTQLGTSDLALECACLLALPVTQLFGEKQFYLCIILLKPVLLMFSGLVPEHGLASCRRN